LPIYNDPLLCELYFRNYAKYKNKYIDKLYVLLSSFRIISGDTTAEYALKNKAVVDEIMADVNERITNLKKEPGPDPIDFDDLTRRIYEHELTHKLQAHRIKEHEHKTKLLIKLLENLGICNYEIIPTEFDRHGHIIAVGMNAANCDNAHIVIEEQDAYWLNDNYKQHLDMLQHIDIIGAPKTTLTMIDVAKFNRKFNRSWSDEHLYMLHLPQFLSNRAVGQIDKFYGLMGAATAKEFDIGDVLTHGDDNTHIHFDTFQHTNLEIYKKTNEVKYFNAAESTSQIDVKDQWNIVSELIDKAKNTNTIIGSNYNDKILYHSGESRTLAFANLSASQSKDKIYNLLKDYAVTTNTDNDFDFIKELRCSFYYQSTNCLHTLYNKDNYLSNLNHLQEVVDFHKHDCSELIKKIL